MDNRILPKSPVGCKVLKSPVKGRVAQKLVTQLPLWQQNPEEPAYLQIAPVPPQERISPQENRYILLIQPQGIRACGGQFTADEAHQIANTTKGWDWGLDRERRPLCQPALERLLDSIIKQSSQGRER